eukprot:2982340-Prymnesium_polylepis.1
MAEPPVAPLGKRNLDDDESWEDAAKRLRGQDSQAAPDAEAAALEFAAAGVLMQQPPELPPAQVWCSAHRAETPLLSREPPGPASPV